MKIETLNKILVISWIMLFIINLTIAINNPSYIAWCCVGIAFGGSFILIMEYYPSKSLIKFNNILMKSSIESLKIIKRSFEREEKLLEIIKKLKKRK